MATGRCRGARGAPTSGGSAARPLCRWRCTPRRWPASWRCPSSPPSGSSASAIPPAPLPMLTALNNPGSRQVAVHRTTLMGRCVIICSSTIVVFAWEMHWMR
uniref:Uncharacterized protein n=1 Tax=Arundo donax TaxID=35708 RepID=A0A0A9EYR5_ARUDO